MFKNHLAYKSSPEMKRHQFSNSGNSLGIGNLSFIWDPQRKQVVIIMDVSELIGKDVQALLNGNRLILEAALVSPYNRPIKTHLLGQLSREDLEEINTVIGFSELRLKYGYEYQLLSCQTIEPKMIKVILGYKDKTAN